MNKHVSFQEKLVHSIELKQSCVCVGLDSRYDRIPDYFKNERSVSESIFFFNQYVVNATHEYAAGYKSNVSFYAGYGVEGLEGLRLTNQWIKKTYPKIPLLADCKRSEMGESVMMVKQEIFDWLLFDCVMVTPWFGFDTIRDYLLDSAKGVCVYVHDSNPTAAEYQDLELKNGDFLYEYITKRIVSHWNESGNVFVEAGATYPHQLKRVREIVGDDMVILATGIGPQGATIEQVNPSIFGKNGLRLLINSSRGIIFAGEGSDNCAHYCEKVSMAAKDIRDRLRMRSGKF